MEELKEKVLKGLDACYNNTLNLTHCSICPYNEEKRCIDKLASDCETIIKNSQIIENADNNKYIKGVLNMGTRNLTMVQKNNELKIAQYGQWDGYPRGQGMFVLNFAKSKTDMEKLKNAVDNIKFLGSDTTSNMYMTYFDNNKVHTENDIYYYQNLISRDICSTILKSVIDIEKSRLPKELKNIIYLQDERDFGYDGLFCEWAYCINFDTNKLEVYHNVGTPCKGERFYKDKPDKHGYYGIKLIKEYDLANLPKSDVFVKELEDEDKEND